MHNFWIGIACSNHVAKGVEGGFAQLGHGKRTAIAGLQKGDWIAYYSPRTDLRGGDNVQAFTAIGKILSEVPYQVSMNETFKPYRVDVAFETSAGFAPIRPLLDHLDLTRNLGNRWGIVMRRSKTKSTISDFRLIAEAMGLNPDKLLAQK